MSLKKLFKYQKQKSRPDLSEVVDSVTLQVDPAFDRWRLDVYITNLMDWNSRTKIQGLIDAGKILKNGRKTVPGRKVRTGDQITVIIPPPDPEDLAVLEKGTLDKVFEDDFIVVINKPPNLLVHPVGGRRYSSVVNLLHKEYRRPDDPSKDIVPVLAHRIDIETSGALLVVKDMKYRDDFVQLFYNRQIRKKYLAISEGNLPFDEIFVDLPIGPHTNHEMTIARGVNYKKGQDAQTIFKVQKRLHGFDVIECTLLTGRQHQIRVHLEVIGHPILSDGYYGKRRKLLKSDIPKILADTDPFTPVYNDDYNEFFQNLPKRKIDNGKYRVVEEVPPGVEFQHELVKKNDEYETDYYFNAFKEHEIDEDVLMCRTALHSWTLEFIHPVTKQNILSEAPIPDDFKTIINVLKP
ncbi:MAG: RluA family pseudouridine synthase [Planctomycetes bacterium]|nr:RluA family pseudouridine synthase [Planctomycetota bacterium]